MFFNGFDGITTVKKLHLNTGKKENSSFVFLNFTIDFKDYGYWENVKMECNQKSSRLESF